MEQWFGLGANVKSFWADSPTVPPNLYKPLTNLRGLDDVLIFLGRKASIALIAIDAFDVTHSGLELGDTRLDVPSTQKTFDGCTLIAEVAVAWEVLRKSL